MPTPSLGSQENPSVIPGEILVFKGRSQEAQVLNTPREKNDFLR
jgi:hypothetical protein